MSALVSAIIVNYQAAALAARAVVSLGAGHRDSNIEVIVVDNSQASSESEALRRIIPPCARLIVNQLNEGFARACNQAYSLANGEYVLLLNPDAYLLPGALERLVQFLNERPRAGAVSPLIYWDDGKHFMLPPATTFSPMHCFRDALVTSSRRLMALYQHWRRHRAWQVLNSNLAIEQTSLSGGLALLRRAAVDASGGLFDPGFFMYFEDTDLFLRMRRKGFRLYMEPRAQAVHNYNQCGLSVGEDKRRFLQDAREFYLNKHDPHRRIRRLCGALRGILPQATAESTEYLGVLIKPPTFPVPEQIADCWLLECSPNASLIPAAVHLGRGCAATFPEDAWRLLAPGRYYARLGGAERFFSYRTWCWDVH